MSMPEEREPAYGWVVVWACFTALAVMTLVEAGKIDLDAPIRRYLPDAPIDNPWEATHPVTVAQVLEHTAGFDDLSLRNFVTERHNLPVQTAVPESAAAFRVRWPPGQRYSYSNPGYLLAGALIEKVSGESFDDYLEQKVLRPLGMHAASYRYAAESGAAQGYNDALAREIYPHAGDRPAGALRASARELSGFVRASSGHCYFNLRDSDGQSAMLRCAMFRRAASLLDFVPRDGELVEVRGRLGVYEARGDLQLIVESLQRAGQGALFGAVAT